MSSYLDVSSVSACAPPSLSVAVPTLLLLLLLLLPPFQDSSEDGTLSDDAQGTPDVRWRLGEGSAQGRAVVWGAQSATAEALEGGPYGSGEAAQEGVGSWGGWEGGGGEGEHPLQEQRRERARERGRERAGRRERVSAGTDGGQWHDAEQSAGQRHQEVGERMGCESIGIPNEAGLGKDLVVRFALHNASHLL